MIVPALAASLQPRVKTVGWKGSSHVRTARRAYVEPRRLSDLVDAHYSFRVRRRSGSSEGGRGF